MHHGVTSAAAAAEAAVAVAEGEAAAEAEAEAVRRWAVDGLAEVVAMGEGGPAEVEAETETETEAEVVAMGEGGPAEAEAEAAVAAVDGGRWTVDGGRWSGGGPAEAVELVGGGATNPVSVGSRFAQYAAGTVSDSQPQHRTTTVEPRFIVHSDYLSAVRRYRAPRRRRTTVRAV